MFELRCGTPTDWVQTVLADFNRFLLDHAACERKASAMGLAFVVQYPDRHWLIEPMIQFAREELKHFHQVSRLLVERKLIMERDEKDPYVNELLKFARTTREERLLDRLLIASVVEARGFERLQMLTDALEDPKLKELYHSLTHAEGGHRLLFVRLATQHFDPLAVKTRLSELLDREEKIVNQLPLRAAVH